MEHRNVICCCCFFNNLVFLFIIVSSRFFANLEASIRELDFFAAAAAMYFFVTLATVLLYTCYRLIIGGTFRLLLMNFF